MLSSTITITKFSTKDVYEIAGADVDLAYYDPPYGSNNEKCPHRECGMRLTITYRLRFA